MATPNVKTVSRPGNSLPRNVTAKDTCAMRWMDTRSNSEKGRLHSGKGGKPERNLSSWAQESQRRRNQEGRNRAGNHRLEAKRTHAPRTRCQKTMGQDEKSHTRRMIGGSRETETTRRDEKNPPQNRAHHQAAHRQAVERRTFCSMASRWHARGHLHVLRRTREVDHLGHRTREGGTRRKRDKDPILSLTWRFTKRVKRRVTPSWSVPMEVWTQTPLPNWRNKKDIAARAVTQDLGAPLFLDLLTRALAQTIANRQAPLLCTPQSESRHRQTERETPPPPRAMPLLDISALDVVPNLGIKKTQVSTVGTWILPPLGSALSLARSHSRTEDLACDTQLDAQLAHSTPATVPSIIDISTVVFADAFCIVLPVSINTLPSRKHADSSTSQCMKRGTSQWKSPKKARKIWEKLNFHPDTKEPAHTFSSFG